MATIDQLELTKKDDLFVYVYVTHNDERDRNPLFVPVSTPDTLVRVDLEQIVGIEDGEFRVMTKASTDPKFNLLRAQIRRVKVPGSPEERFVSPDNVMRARILESAGGDLGHKRVHDPYGIVALEGDPMMERALERRGMGTVAWFQSSRLRFPGITRLAHAAGSVQLPHLIQR